MAKDYHDHTQWKVGSYEWLLTCPVKHMHHLRARELRGCLREAHFKMVRAERIERPNVFMNGAMAYAAVARQLLMCLDYEGTVSHPSIDS